MFHPLLGISCLILIAILIKHNDTSIITESRCVSKCAIVQKCNSRVLFCGAHLSNLSLLENVPCTRNSHVFFVGITTNSVAHYLDPVLLRTLFDEGMRSLFFGVAINNLSRYGFHLLPQQSPVVAIFNSNFVKHIEHRSFEMYNLDAVFYNNSNVKTYKSMKKEVPVRYERFCDSKYAPCLCKILYKLSNPYIDSFGHFFNESSSLVCKGLYSAKCTQPSCSIPERLVYSTELHNLRQKKIVVDNYCSSSSARCNTVIMLTLFTCLSLMFS